MGKNKEVFNSSINVALLQAASKTSGRQHLQKIIENTDSISKLLKQTKRAAHTSKPSTSQKENVTSSSDSESDSEGDIKKSPVKQEHVPKAKSALNVGSQKSSPKKRKNGSSDSESSSGSGNSSSSDSEGDLKQKSITEAKIQPTNDSSEDSESGSSTRSEHTTKQIPKNSNLNVSTSASIIKERKKEVISSSDSNSDSNSDSEEEIVSSKTAPNITELPKEKSLNSTLKQHFEDEKGFKKLDRKGLTLPQLSEDTELYLMQIPKSLNAKSLINQQISLDSKTKIHLDGHKYVFSMSQHKTQPLGLLTTSGNNQLRITKCLLHGNIEAHRALKVKTQHQSSTCNDAEVELPSNIKPRHAVFGDDYSSKLELDEFVKNKLKETIDQFNKQLKHKEKKKYKKPEKDKSKEEMIFTILNAQKSPKEKHKKKKDQTDLEVTLNTSLEKSTKKSKKHDSSKNAETQLYKKNKVKDDIDTTDSNLLELPSFLLKKHETKQEKIVNSTMVNDNKNLSRWDLSRISLNPNEIVVPVKKKKKHKTHDDEETSLRVEPYTNNVSESSIQELLKSEAALFNGVKERKKKKHKHKVHENDNTSTITTPCVKPIDSSMGNVNFNETPSFSDASDTKKEKKKHKRDREISETVEASPKKKKEKSIMERSSLSKNLSNTITPEEFNESLNKKEKTKHKRDREISETVEASPKKKKEKSIMECSSPLKSLPNTITREEFDENKIEKKKHKRNREISEGIETSPKKKKAEISNSPSKSLLNTVGQEGFDETSHRKEKKKHKTSFDPDDSTEIKVKKKKKNKSTNESDAEQETVSSDVIDEIMQSVVHDLGIKKKKSKKKKLVDE